MKKVLFIAPYARDKRQLYECTAGSEYLIMFDNTVQEWLEQVAAGQGDHEHINPSYIFTLLDSLHAKYSTQELDGLLSSHDYLSALVASILAQRLSLYAPLPKAIIDCQHKYYSRHEQMKHIPEAVPLFSLIDPEIWPQNKQHVQPLEFPFFVKPVKSYFSLYTQEVCTQQELQKYLESSCINDYYAQSFNLLMKDYGDYSKHVRHILAESLLFGQEVILEGFVYEKKYYPLGLVDCVLSSERMPFWRFEYPSSLEESVQKHIIDLADRVLRGIGFDRGYCNIKFMYNPERKEVHLIDINPTINSQLADLYERVDGMNTYEVLLDLAVGRVPTLLHRKGSFSMAASCALSVPQEYYVAETPSPDSLKKVIARFPDARVEILAHQGKNVQRAKNGYCYGIINLGGHDRQDLLHRFELCSSLLDFKLMPL